MNTPTRVAAFVAALAAAFALAWGGGRLVGPLDTEPAAAAHDDGEHAAADPGEQDDHGTDDPGDHDEVAEATGLTARADGFSLRLLEPVYDGGRARLDFQVLTSGGAPLRDYTREHDKDLHLIVVRRDLTGFQHVHPRLDAETGTWSVRVRLTPGVWRVIADFTPEGWEPVTLADDLSVAGDFRPRDLPDDTRTTTVRSTDGDYTVTLGGDTAPGVSTVLTPRIDLDGEPVTDLEPYLGAYGHLVAIRAGDLGYLHVHPEDSEAGPSIDFATAFPTPGTYRLFLDFKHRGIVRTAEFTVESGGAPGSADEHAEEGDSHDD